jgi:hypothetical protein
VHRTATETADTTLTRLIKAMDRQHPVTITYLKEAKDDAGHRTGGFVQTIRTVEVFDVRVSQAGDILIVGMDRETAEQRSFRLDRITEYTTHRGTGYVVEREPATTPRQARPGSLASAVAGVQVLLAELEDLDTVLLGAGLVDLVADSLTTAA